MSNPIIYQPNEQYQQHGQAGQPQPGQKPCNDFRNYQFSPEEKRVLGECASESFWYRSLPLSLGLGTAAYMGVKNGLLQASKSYGPWPKVIGMGFFGYIAGRISYISKCQEKIMALPNSQYAEFIRARFQKGNRWDLGAHDAEAAALSMAPFQSATSSYSDDQPNALNLDSNRPNYAGLEDTYQPTMEGNNDLNEDLAIPTRKNSVSYDELRRMNRDEYARSHNQLPPAAYYRNAQAAPPQPPTGPLNPPAGSYNPTSNTENGRRRSRRSEDESTGGPKNRYGDAWSE